jgi:hypothetical protein
MRDLEKMDMFSRNWLYISPGLQESLKHVKVMVVGCGLGSRICEIAARTGFENFTIADGDVVEESNLNRQYFSRGDLGRNKAYVTRTNLYLINPECEVKAIPQFLDFKALSQTIPYVDIVVNTIDFEHPAFVDCSDLCRQFDKLELFPTNLGFGGTIVAARRQHPTFEGYFGTNVPEKLKKQILEYLLKDAFPYMLDAYERYLGERECPDPQLGIAVAATAGLAVTIMVQYVAGEKLKYFPIENYRVDLYGHPVAA